MPEKYNKVWTRAQWQETRTKLQVPKGAAPLGVSMGDALEKFHKAAAAGPAQGLKAVPALEKTIVAYKKAIKAKYPTAHARIERDLDHYLASYKNDATAILKSLKDYVPARAAASAQMQQVGAEFIQQGEPGILKPTNDKRAAAAVMAFYDVIKKLPFHTDAFKKESVQPYFQAAKWAEAGQWNRKTIDGLMRMLANFPDRP